MNNDLLSNDFKADPLGGIIPQERVTGDILKGRGPRRGNLERLLRYWRPIMKKPGGFSRCRVILADHPELYPLENICAWLHHETTGLWPNEGCHHPGMKNCKGKLKKNNWTDADFARRLTRPINAPGKLGGKSAYEEDVFFSPAEWSDSESKANPVVTQDDLSHAMKVLADFVEMEPDFSDYLRNNDNWETVGESPDGKMITAEYLPTKCCG
jgi:hypothetical protein